MKSTCFWILWIVIFLATLPARAEVLVYPQEKPMFSITFPDEWKTELDKEVLHAFPEDESIYLGLWALEGSENLEAALDALDENLAEFFSVLKTGEPDTVTIKDLLFLTADGTGTTKDDHKTKVNVSVSLFSPNGETIFILLYFGTSEAEAKYEEVLGEIINSITVE